jgi:hypothetical protein
MLDEVHHSPFQQPVKQPASYGKEKKRFVAALRHYRCLNLQMVVDKYPLPNMANLAARLASGTIFSKLDVKKGYLQVPVATADVAKTAIITPFGLFEFVRMPFGLKNAGMSFQRLMDSLLGGLPFAFVYLDNILIASSSSVEHCRHLRKVFSLLEQSCLIVNPEKCIFGHDTIDFLGHRISPMGTSLLPSRVSAPSPNPQAYNHSAASGLPRAFQFLQEVHPSGGKAGVVFNLRSARQPSRRLTTGLVR